MPRPGPPPRLLHPPASVLGHGFLGSPISALVRGSGLFGGVGLEQIRSQLSQGSCLGQGLGQYCSNPGVTPTSEQFGTLTQTR
jgi:hypothetical protein